METLTAVRRGEIVMPVPIQLLYGASPMDTEILELPIPEQRQDDTKLDEALEARCCSL